MGVVDHYYQYGLGSVWIGWRDESSVVIVRKPWIGAHRQLDPSSDGLLLVGKLPVKRQELVDQF